MTWYEHDWLEARKPPSRPAVAVPLPARNDDDLILFDSYLGRRQLDPDLAEKNGWYPGRDARDLQEPRVIIPAATLTNSWPYYQGRAIRETAAKRYLSPPVPRGDALCVVWPNGQRRGVLIVEGPMDALAAAMCGYIGIGLMGNTPNPEVIGHILRYTHVTPVYIMADADAVAEAMKMSALLWKEGVECTLRLPGAGYKDLAAMPHESRLALLTAT